MYIPYANYSLDYYKSIMEIMQKIKAIQRLVKQKRNSKSCSGYQINYNH